MRVSLSKTKVRKFGIRDGNVRRSVNEKLECIDKFCCLGERFGASGGMEEASKPE